MSTSPNDETPKPEAENVVSPNGKVGDGSSQWDVATLRKMVDDLNVKLNRQKINLKSKYKRSKEDLEAEVESWKEDFDNATRALEKSNFSLNLSKQEVKSLKENIKDTTTSKNDEIARLKRDSKLELKKVNEELRKRKRENDKLTTELEKSRKENKEVTRKLSQANMSVVNLNHDMKALQQKNKSMQSSLNKALSKIEGQMETKMNHDIEVAKLRLSQEQAKANKARDSMNASARRAQEEFERRRALLQIQSEIRMKEKEKSNEQKENERKKKMADQNEKFKFARTMMQKTMTENGGSFLKLKSTQDVSTRYC